MAKTNDDSFLFVVEWFDPMPQLKRKYLLKYFIDQHMVEMIDLKSKKMFLKKSVCPPEVSSTDFILGGKVLLYSRMLEIVDYGDLKTRDKLGFQVQKCIAILPADSYSNWGKLISDFNSKMVLVSIKTMIIPQNVADSVCQVLEVNSRNSAAFSKGVNLVATFSGEDGFSIAKKIESDASCDIFVTGNGIQTADLSDVLKKAMSDTSTLDSCSCGVIKPHAVKSKQAGGIMDHILSQGYEISAVTSLFFDKVQAEEFYEVYKDVVPEYNDHVQQLCSGLVIALEVRAESAVQVFRQTAGPWDTDMAKELRPDSVRGKFGLDQIRNALHCTDLPTDGTMEVEYCFKIMQSN
jgi:nucleoside-diphosphate kinase